jgi:hypothetical protein
MTAQSLMPFMGERVFTNISGGFLNNPQQVLDLLKDRGMTINKNGLDIINHPDFDYGAKFDHLELYRIPLSELFDDEWNSTTDNIRESIIKLGGVMLPAVVAIYARLVYLKQPEIVNGKEVMDIMVMEKFHLTPDDGGYIFKLKHSLDKPLRLSASPDQSDMKPNPGTWHLHHNVFFGVRK